MKVFLLKDIQGIGVAGEVISVGDGYARNYLIPLKFAVEVTRENNSGFEKIRKTIKQREQVIATETSLLAEKIRSTKLTLKRKMHFDPEHKEGRLYGSISAKEIVELLAEHNISVSKSQILFEKSIKTQGSHEVVVKLSSRLQPKLTVKVVSE